MIREYIDNIAAKFYEKTLNHDNMLIKNITETRIAQTKHQLPYQHLGIYLQQP